MHPSIAPYQEIFQKYNLKEDTSIDVADIDVSIEMFLTEVARHNNLPLLKDIIEKSKKNTTTKNCLQQWLRGATTAAILEKNTEMLLYLMETEVKVHDRSAGCLQLLRSLTLKDDLTDFDRVFNQIAAHKWKLYPTTTLGSAHFFFNLIGRNEIERVKHVCQHYVVFEKDQDILNQSGVYACYYNSEDTLKYLLQQPYETHNWTMWLMGAADSFAVCPNTTCTDMLLDAVPSYEKINFFTQVVERLQRTDKRYLPFLGVVLKHMLDLSLSDQKELLCELKYQNDGVFVHECSQALSSNLLNKKISKNLTHSEKSRTKKM